MTLPFGTAAARGAARAGPVAQVGGEQGLARQEGGEELAHLGVDGLEALAELGQPWLCHYQEYIIKPCACQPRFSPIG